MESMTQVAPTFIVTQYKNKPVKVEFYTKTAGKIDFSVSTKTTSKNKVRARRKAK